MARRRSKKQSDQFLKSVIRLGIFAVIRLLFQVSLCFLPDQKRRPGVSPETKKRSRPSPNRKLLHRQLQAQNRHSPSIPDPVDIPFEFLLPEFNIQRGISKFLEVMRIEKRKNHRKSDVKIRKKT